MTMLTDEQCISLGVALNEATLLGFEVSPERRIAAATFQVLTLPEEGPPPEDTRVQFLFGPVGRLVASLRAGAWDDPTAEIVPFSISDLLGVVQEFQGLPIYGWEFFDIHEKTLDQWGDRLSLDWASGSDGLAHSISVFQDANDRILEICLWFDAFKIRNASGAQVPLEEFIAGGERWWDGLHTGDPRTSGHGIFSAGDPAG